MHNKSDSFKIFKKALAFTLSEIMITLSILGIIAIITIPRVINNIRKQELLTKLKMSVSILNDAVGNSQAYNGHVESWNYSIKSNQSAKEFAKQYLIPYLNVIDECTYGSADSKCFRNNKFYTPANQEFGGIYVNGINTFTSIYMFRLKNNISYGVQKVSGNTVRVYIDVNGPKKGHSKAGEDVYVFQINKNGVTPYEHWYASTGGRGRGECLTGNVDSGAGGTGGGGTSCAAYIIANGWKFPKDYNPFNMNMEGFVSYSGPSICVCQMYTSKNNNKEKTCCDGTKIKFNENTGQWEKVK